MPVLHLSRRQVLSLGGAHLSLKLSEPLVVLLGDSTLDNAAYAGPGRDVATVLKRSLILGNVVLLARDGDVMADIPAQLGRTPNDATHLVVSIGGNDALRAAAILDQESNTVGEGVLKLSDVTLAFRTNYAGMLRDVAQRNLSTTICTIYEPRYEDLIKRRVAATALALVNDAIIQEAILHGLPIIDFRLVCREDSDFANPIEPSERGSEKIARAIARVIERHDFRRREAAIYK